jgi:hypothetical protein
MADLLPALSPGKMSAFSLAVKPGIYRIFKKFDVSRPVSTARRLLHWQPVAHTKESTSEKTRYPNPPTDRDTSTINSIKLSSIRYGHLERPLSVKVSRRDGLQCRLIRLKLLELEGLR